ncbi:hypothetical protein Q0N30_25875 [Priestia megaterium]|uniref:hypothetical protein n=1 Tax=Priestia megaterium TaxID=1404 RepID=UPI00345AFF0A
MSTPSQDENTIYIEKDLKIRKAKGTKKIIFGPSYGNSDTIYVNADITYGNTDMMSESADTITESADMIPESADMIPESINTACKDNESICKSCVCELLNQIANKEGVDLIIGHENKVLLLNKHTSQPISVDGMDPTIFTLEKFNPETCCAIFSFDREMMDSTTGSTPVKGKFIEDCSNISGVFFIEDTDEDW